MTEASGSCDPATRRKSGDSHDDIDHMLERELDWAELASSLPDRFGIVES